MKKISQIIAYSLLGLLVVGLILCAIIKIDFKPDINIPTTTSTGTIEVKATDGTTNMEADDANINYKKFGEIFDNSFKLTVLYSLFSGKLGSEITLDEKLESKPAVSGYMVTIYYANADNNSQTISYKGKELKYSSISSPISYNAIMFGVEDGKGLKDNTIYFFTTGKNTFYPVEVLANFDELYNYIENIQNIGD